MSPRSVALTLIHRACRRGPFRGRGLLLGLARRLARGRPTAVRLWPGITLCLGMSTEYETLLLLGAYEPAVLSLICGMLRPGDLFIDGGANIGLYTLAAARAVGPTGLVLAYEPDPIACERACENLRLNPELATQIKLRRLALAARCGSAGLVSAGECQLESRLAEALGPERLEVETTTLDQELSGVALQRFVVAKLDVEGAEIDALRGARRMLECEEITVISELNDEMLSLRGSSADALIAAFEGWGFLPLTEAGKPLGRRDPEWPPWKNGVFIKGQEAMRRFQAATQLSQERR